MKSSVIIPAYNEEKFLPACLEAIKNQTKAPFEVIVVDNNSTDKTSEIAKKMGAKVIKEKKQGASYARNAGYTKAIGDIILRTDADTIVPKNWVETFEKSFDGKNVNIVCGSVEYYYKWLDPLSNFLIFWIDDIFGYKAATGPNYAIKKELWRKIENQVHNDNKKFHEDLDLAIHAQKFKGYKRVYTLKVTSSPRKFGDFKTFFVKYPRKSLFTLFNKEHRKLSSNPLIRAI